MRSSRASTDVESAHFHVPSRYGRPWGARRNRPYARRLFRWRWLWTCGTRSNSRGHDQLNENRQEVRSLHRPTTFQFQIKPLTRPKRRPKDTIGYLRPKWLKLGPRGFLISPRRAAPYRPQYNCDLIRARWAVLAYNDKSSCNPSSLRLSLRAGVVRSRWASWSSKPVAGRVAGRGGFDSHPLPPMFFLCAARYHQACFI